VSRRIRSGVETDDQEAGGGKRRCRDLERGDPLFGQAHGEADGDYDLGLNHERRQTW
jgi:hypothetical protein